MLLRLVLIACVLGAACIGGPQPEPPTQGPDSGAYPTADGGIAPGSDAGAAADGGPASVDAGRPTILLPTIGVDRRWPRWIEAQIEAERGDGGHE